MNPFLPSGRSYFIFSWLPPSYTFTPLCFKSTFSCSSPSSPLPSRSLLHDAVVTVGGEGDGEGGERGVKEERKVVRLTVVELIDRHSSEGRMMGRGTAAATS